jgi:hypothetical protein
VADDALFAEKASEQPRGGRVSRMCRLVAGRGAGCTPGDAERDEFSQTGLDVLLEPAKALHEPLDAERIAGPGV